MSTSCVILTLNEEVNLPGCLDSLAWCDDIVVFDSHSTDRTVEIAQSRGCRVVQRNFDDYAAQRTAALHEVEYRHPWVLMIDADERVPAALANEIATVTETAPDEVALYRVRRKDHFQGRWIRHASGYPTWFGRLVRPKKIKVARAVNEEYDTDGGVLFLTEHLEHFPFQKGIAWWVERHNRYSTMEAALLAAEPPSPIWGHLLAHDPAKRRKALKAIAYRLPFRPALVFAYLYVFRGGFLDGPPGYRFCALRAGYEFLIDMKILELRRTPASE